MAKLLMIVSSARTIRLADGSDHPTGYRAEEVRKPHETFVSAGADVVIATPDGRVPRPDPGASSRSSTIRRWMRTSCSRCCAGSLITPTASG
jgi:putative intracellular protease/amidase